MNEEMNSVVEQPEIVIEVLGVVCDCTKLNVRRAPNKNAEVTSIISAGDTVKISPNSLEKPWYRVTTETGTKGFCMRDYIDVQQ